MRKTIFKISTSALAVFMFFLTTTAFSGENVTDMGGIAPKETASYQVPEEKTQLWEDLKNVAQNDFDVCQEHCGSEQNCLDKCESAYNTRLERNYNTLLQGNEPAAEN